MNLEEITPLSPFNYDEWKPRMIAYLKSHDLFDCYFEREFESSTKKIKWLNKGDMHIGRMKLTMTDYILYPTIIDIETPKELWAHLDERFGKKNDGFGPNPFKSKQGDAFAPLDGLSDHDAFAPPDGLSDHVAFAPLDDLSDHEPVSSHIEVVDKELADSPLMLKLSSLSVPAHTLDIAEGPKSSLAPEFVGLHHDHMIISEVTSAIGGNAFAPLQQTSLIYYYMIISTCFQKVIEEYGHCHPLEIISHASYDSFDLTLAGSKEISRNCFESLKSDFDFKQTCNSYFWHNLTHGGSKEKTKDYMHFHRFDPTSADSNHRFKDHSHTVGFVLITFDLKSKYKHMLFEHDPLLPKKKIPPDI
jgi:hypothetical protein